jgi:hypothetical protein
MVHRNISCFREHGSDLSISLPLSLSLTLSTYAYSESEIEIERGGEMEDKEQQR